MKICKIRLRGLINIFYHWYAKCRTKYQNYGPRFRFIFLLHLQTLDVDAILASWRINAPPWEFVFSSRCWTILRGNYWWLTFDTGWVTRIILVCFSESLILARRGAFIKLGLNKYRSGRDRLYLSIDCEKRLRW